MGKNKKSLKNNPINENLKFLITIKNNTVNEIKKINAYLGNLNHNKKIIEQLIEKVK